MKKITKSLLVFLVLAIILFATTSLIIGDPNADYVEQNLSLNDLISLSEIPTENSEIGAFRSSLKFKQNSFESSAKEFYGQEIIIEDNPQVDRILIGVTNNLISRIEIWCKDKLIETKELGFMSKMTWGENQTMTVAFYDHTNMKYNGKSKISMRFYSRIGFLGEIATINFDLTKYGDFSSNKSIGVFAKSIDSNSVNEPEFSDLRIWKNYTSFD